MKSLIQNGYPGVVLAGGRSLRMGGGDKCLSLLGDRPILAHVIGRIRPQVSVLALNANGDPSRFAAFGLPVIPDDAADSAGPLAGILAGFDWLARSEQAASHLLTVPSDTPFLPRDLVPRLAAVLGSGIDAALAKSAGRLHPVIGLWPYARREALRLALRREGLRRVEDWADRLGATAVEFATATVDPFLNVNLPADLAAAAGLLEQDRNLA